MFETPALIGRDELENNLLEALKSLSNTTKEPIRELPAHLLDPQNLIQAKKMDVAKMDLILVETWTKKLTIPLHNNFALQVSSINRFQYTV